jgi:hypothetical protein
MPTDDDAVELAHSWLADHMRESGRVIVVLSTNATGECRYSLFTTGAVVLGESEAIETLTAALKTALGKAYATSQPVGDA